ncbi:non-ribosomal peptide synthetase [Scytonema millei]|uniref:Non-ribosomal peptide synthetase n=1 Tax=Scytonema millei VB511283 TaxID=1245923 RepID=A0A9X5EAV1_9CYAN|nr:non-ribosomal peptide synthetase [Scytonema millei]NHC37938.1 non-ribosomal peptide synthetase [Scytonema millei VB511283]
MQTETISGFELSPQQKRLWLLQQDSPAYITECAISIEGALQPEVLKAALQHIIYRNEIFRTIFRRLPGRKLPVMAVVDDCLPEWQAIDPQRSPLAPLHKGGNIVPLHQEDWERSPLAPLQKEGNIAPLIKGGWGGSSDLNHDAQAIAIEALFQEASRHSFDFESGSLLRLSLLKLSANLHVLHVCLPSLCADSRTIANLIAEIGNSYSACLQSRELEAEVVQYCQFSTWQNQLLADTDAEEANAYWRERVASLELKLPFENKPLKQTKFQPECFELAIALTRITQIENLARKFDTTIAIVLLACWQTLLWRLTQQEITIGVASDRREYEELDRVMGLLATWLPIETNLVPDLRFQEVVELAAKTLSQAEEWQDYFTPKTTENNNTLAFPIGFEFEQLPEKISTAGVTFSLDKQYSCIEQFKVKLTCTQRDNSLSTAFYYDINYFSVDTIQRLAAQFQTLLTHAIENPEIAIAQLQILSQGERQQLLLLNQTQTDYSLDKCIHQLFEAQVERSPDKIAVVFEDRQLTYAQLNAEANQLARYLQQLGVKPEVLVGLYLERSLLTLVGLLGILKAGGAYLPLDPALPAENLTFRLQDAQAAIVLTQQHLVETLPPHSARAICLDADWDEIARYSDENLTSEVTVENLVYVLYTSGSTGKPKGVAIEHRQLLNYFYAIAPQLNLSTDASFATVSTFAADLGNTCIFPALCQGGCLHIVSQQRASDPVALADYCDRHAIDCLKIVPSHLAALLASPSPAKILPRQCLVLGGEAASWNLIEQIQQYAPTCRIINHYGPTETTVGVLTYPLETRQKETRQQDSATVPLGRPLANMQVYVLDRQLQPVPIGVPGELYIAGAGVARGYLNRPDLTQERFIPNPWENSKVKIDANATLREQNSKFLSSPAPSAPSALFPDSPVRAGFEQRFIDVSRESFAKPAPTTPDSRLYKTGDLVRFLPDGDLEFLGRLDDQVKVRGFRIELGEVEAALRQHPQVREAIVIVREDKLGDRRLVAYVVPSQSTASTNDLRLFLKDKLPEYMMPSAFVLLKQLPLTPNGKVDRQVLPAPDASRPDLADTFVAPRTPVEKSLVEIWAEVLRLERIGINDNFFDLGGHSLLVTQVVSRVRDAFEIELPLRDFFAAPTVADLAVKIAQKLAQETDSELLAQTLAELEQLSEAEIQTLLASETESNDREGSRK